MVAFGQVHNGVVVLDAGATFPDGSRVAVTLAPQPTHSSPEKRRIELPLVRTGEPGTWDLTNERIAEILDEEDRESMKDIWNAPS